MQGLPVLDVLHFVQLVSDVQRDEETKHPDPSGQCQELVTSPIVTARVVAVFFLKKVPYLNIVLFMCVCCTYVGVLIRKKYVFVWPPSAPSDLAAKWK